MLPITRRGRFAAALMTLLVLALVAPATGLAVSAPGYIVRLKAEPLASYQGGTKGLRPTSPQVTGRPLTRTAPAVQAYRSHLATTQRAALARLGTSAPDPFYSYRFAFAGFAAHLTPDQVATLRAAPEVASVERNELRHPTAVSPGLADWSLGGPTGDGASYLGLPKGLWRQLGGADHAGEGIVVGVLDTGIAPEHPSFSDNGQGYVGAPYTAPEVWDGVCQAGDDFPSSACNNKLIGARYFVAGFGADHVAGGAFLSPRDDDGHGSHTASTAAGNFGVDPVIDGNGLGVNRIAGIAPRAYVAAYKVCWPGGDVPSGCSSADTVDAVDMAIADGVDVINYSVGSSSSTALSPDSLAFLGAEDAGVFVATSAGNDGPVGGTIGTPAAVPWVTTVGASTLARTFQATATIVSGATTLTVTGASVTNALPASPLVDAADSAAEGVDAADAQQCLPGSLDPAAVEGTVVLCARGGNDRVEKSKVVADAGGVGMILYNVDPASDDILTDNHWVPSVHITAADGARVRALVRPGATAALSAGRAAALSRGGILAAFSSRGPQTSVPDIPKPDVVAPGVNILAAASPSPAEAELRPGQLFQSISGTSMSSPHVAGAAALLRQAHPDWDPSVVKSALMTSASSDVLLEDGTTPAGPFAAGSGEIRPNRAVDPGLVLDETTPGYLGYLKGQAATCVAEIFMTCLDAIGLDPETVDAIPAIAAIDLNLPAVSASNLVGSASTTRTFTSVDSAPRTWSVSIEGLPGVLATPTPRRFSIRPGRSQSVDLDFAETTAPLDAYVSGALVLTSGARTVRVPITLQPGAIDAPATVPVTTTAAAGSTPLPVRTGFTGTLNGIGSGLAAPVSATATISATSGAPDPSGDDPGTQVHPFTVADGAQLLRAAITDADAGDPGTDLDLYLYQDLDKDGKFGDDELVALSGSGTSNESLQLTLPDGGDYELAVTGFATKTGGSTYSLSRWVVDDPEPDAPAPAPGIVVTGDPAVVTPGGEAPLSLDWSGVTAPGTYYGLITYHNGDAGTDPVGLSVVRLTRTAAP